MQGLTDADALRVAAYLRIAAEQLHCEWKIVFAGEVQVLLLGEGEPQTVRGILDSPKAILRLIDPTPDSPPPAGTLSRPLQYDAFLEALQAVERRIDGRPPAAKPRLTEAATSRSATSAHAAAPGATFKLRRWPPAAMLHGSRYHLRLASFLSARHVEVGELARLSNVDPAQCQRFLDALAAEGLLDIRAPAESTDEPAVGSEAADRSKPRSTSNAPVGLLGKIRRRLGIAWPS